MENHEPSQSSFVAQSLTSREKRTAWRHGQSQSRTAKRRELQEQVYLARVIEHLTVRQVAEKLGIATETVMAYEKAEQVRRVDEIASQREEQQANHLALIDDLHRSAMALRSVPGTGSLAAAAKAIEMRAKILGLDAPTRIDIGVQRLVEAFEPAAETIEQEPRSKLPSRVE